MLFDLDRGLKIVSLVMSCWMSYMAPFGRSSRLSKSSGRRAVGDDHVLA